MLKQSSFKTTHFPVPAVNGWPAYNSIFTALVLCVAGLAAVYVANSTTSFRATGESLGVGLAMALLFMAWRRWQFGVQALLVVVIVEGALRKWFLPSYADLVYFYKDALMVAVLIAYFLDRGKAKVIIQRELQFFVIPLFALVLYAFAISANPRAPHLITSIFGVKAYCLYMPLAFLLPRMFSTKEKLVGVLRWYLVIALMVAALGVWQFMDNSQDSALNRYAQSENPNELPQDTAIFADSSGDYFVRVTGTFSFISGLTVYLPVAFSLLLGLTSLGATRTLPISVRLIYYLGIAGVVATAFMSGSRAVIVNLVMVAVIFFAFTSINNAFKRLRQVVIGGALVFMALNLVVPHAVDGVYQRAFGGEEQIDEGRERIEAVFTFPFEEAAYAGAFGYGIGATQNSVPALMNRLNLTPTGEPIPMAVESESSRVMLELGVVGFVLFTLVRLATLVATLRACLVIRDPEMKALGVASFASLLFSIVAGGAVINHTQNVYQWFLVGMVFALLNADRLARATNPILANPIHALAMETRLSASIPALDRR
jgi:hypothetical protein